MGEQDESAFVFREPAPAQRKRASRTSARTLGDCWECHKAIGRTAKVCPHCGADQAKRPPSTAAVVFAFVVVALGIAAIGYAVIAQAQKDRDMQQFLFEMERDYGDAAKKRK